MMTATECPSIERLKDLTLGRLAEEDSDSMLDHLRDCEVCQSELETIGDGEDSLIQAIRSPDDASEWILEPQCDVAVIAALGAIGIGQQSPTISDMPDFPVSIGEYEIVRPLGRGGMGNVYLARHTKLGRLVALKVLAGHRLADAKMKERFEAEMRAVGQLSHPGIVTAHDAREIDGTAVLITEFIDGMDLAQLVSRIGPIEIADACDLIRQVAVALQYTSDQGFVHRDVKPSNIMLGHSGEVKLLDLGLARLQEPRHETSGLTGTGQAMGTADYIAPRAGHGQSWRRRSRRHLFAWLHVVQIADWACPVCWTAMHDRVCQDDGSCFLATTGAQRFLDRCTRWVDQVDCIDVGQRPNVTTTNADAGR